MQGERSAIPPALGGYSRADRNFRSERLFLTNPRINEQGTIDMPHLDDGARKNINMTYFIMDNFGDRWSRAAGSAAAAV